MARIYQLHTIKMIEICLSETPAAFFDQRHRNHYTQLDNTIVPDFYLKVLGNDKCVLCNENIWSVKTPFCGGKCYSNPRVRIDSKKCPEYFQIF